MKIKLMMDSTCDLSKDILEKYEICEIVPMSISMGDTTYKDGDFTIPEMYSYVDRTKELPKTSAINSEEFSEAFRRHTADGSAVLLFPLSKNLTVGFQNAVNAAKNFENVHVVDVKQLSTGTSLLMMYARDLLNKNPNMNAKEAADILNGLSDKIQTSFCVDVITYLYKGGRCNALSLLGANLMKIHPSLHMKDGYIAAGKKYRGKMSKVISEYIEDLRTDNPNYDNTRCFITYTEGTDPEVVEIAKEKTREIFDFKELIETTAGATITCHCGKGTLGLLFMNK